MFVFTFLSLEVFIGWARINRLAKFFLRRLDTWYNSVIYFSYILTSSITPTRYIAQKLVPNQNEVIAKLPFYVNKFYLW